MPLPRTSASHLTERAPSLSARPSRRADGPDAVLGKLKNTGAKAGSSTATQWSVVCEGVEGKPTTYQLKKSQSFAKGPTRQPQPRMHIISEGVREQPQRFAVAAGEMLLLTPARTCLQPKEAARLKPKVEGLVSQQYELAPPSNDRTYRELQGARVAQIGQERDGRAQVTMRLPSVIMEDLHQKEQIYRDRLKAKKEEKETTLGNKRFRGDKSEVQNKLFKLLEDQSSVCEGKPHPEGKDGKPETCIHCRTHWKTQDLIEQTQQPEAFLKMILKEMCEYEKRGEHQGTWVLKSWSSGLA